MAKVKFGVIAVIILLITSLFFITSCEKVAEAKAIMTEKDIASAYGDKGITKYTLTFSETAIRGSRMIVESNL